MALIEEYQRCNKQQQAVLGTALVELFGEDSTIANALAVAEQAGITNCAELLGYYLAHEMTGNDLAVEANADVVAHLEAKGASQEEIALGLAKAKQALWDSTQDHMAEIKAVFPELAHEIVTQVQIRRASEIQNIPTVDRPPEVNPRVFGRRR